MPRRSETMQSVNMTKLKIVRARLRSPASSFKNLLVDPFTLDSHHMELTSPEVHGAIEELQILDTAVMLQYALDPDVRREIDQAFDDAFFQCMRLIWPTFILWLDFLHPMHHKDTRSFEHVPLTVLINVLYTTFVARGAQIAALRASNLRLHQLMFLLWLHLDRYCTPGTNFCALIDTLTCAIRAAMGFPEKRAAFLAQVDPNRTGHVSKTDMIAFISANLPPHCVPAALYAAGGLSRNVYRLSLKQTKVLVKVASTRPDNTIISSALSSQIDTISQLAEGALVTSAHAQSTVTSMVGILRALQGLQSSGRYAMRVVYVLFNIWRDCDDGRSIAWAVDNDVLAILLTLYKESSDPHHRQRIDTVLLEIAQNSFQIRVARAFSTGNLNFSFRGAGFAHPDMIVAVDQWIAHRAELARRTYRKGCFYSGCPGQQSAGRVRRCPCLSASYCSKACQRGDWQTHKAQCLQNSQLHWMRLMSPAMLENHPLDHAHFIAVCAKDSFTANVVSIVLSIERLLENVPSMKHAPVISIMIDVARLFCTYRVFADKQVDDFESSSKSRGGMGAVEKDEAGPSYTSMGKTPGGSVFVYKDTRQIQVDPPILIMATAGGKVFHVMGDNLSKLKALAKARSDEEAGL